MMIPFLMAAALVSTPDQAILDEARALGRDVAMGQICEAIEAATFDGDALIKDAEDLLTRGQAVNISEPVISGAAEEAHTRLMAELEEQYPDGAEDAALAHLTRACNDLITNRPAYFSAFKAD